MKKITIILAILALFCLVNCSRDKRVDIDKITFGRGCVAIDLTGEALVQKVSIYSDQKKVASKVSGKWTKRAFLDFDWEKENDYRIEVDMKNRSSPAAIILQSPRRPSPILWASFKLEDVEPRGLYDSGYLGGRVTISSDAGYMAVGTEKSYFRVFDAANRRQLWKKRLGEGRILEIKFALQGRYLLVGEQSRDAYLYCFDPKTGKELWKYRAADDVGEIERGEPIHRWPLVAGIAVAENRIYVTAKRNLGEIKGKTRYLARAYCFDVNTGKTIWIYPQNGCMDASPSMVDVDSCGKYAVFNNYRLATDYTKALYCLDGTDGRLLWGWDFEPIFPEKDLRIWHGVGISRDGRYVAALSHQGGRGFLLDNLKLIETCGESDPVWQRDISIPMDINGVTISGSGSVAGICGEYVIFSTGQTHVRFGNKGVSIDHPTANSIFIYDLDGHLSWTRKMGGLTYTIPVSPDGRYVVLAARHSRVEKDVSKHGVYLFDNFNPGGSSNKLVWFFHTEGICLSSAITSDGNYVAALEYPVDTDIRYEFEDVRGKHMVYILR